MVVKNYVVKHRSKYIGQFPANHINSVKTQYTDRLSKYWVIPPLRESATKCDAYPRGTSWLPLLSAASFLQQYLVCHTGPAVTQR